MAQQGLANLGAGGVAMRVQNAITAVRAFAGQHQLAVFAIEIGAPAQQLVDALRTLFHQHARGFAMHEAVARVHGVVEVQGHIFVAAHGNGDAALRVMRVRFAQRFLGDDQDARSIRCQSDGRAQAGNARAHDHEIRFPHTCHKLSGYSISRDWWETATHLLAIARAGSRCPASALTCG